jgi:hypothetical protein
MNSLIVGVSEVSGSENKEERKQVFPFVRDHMFGSDASGRREARNTNLLKMQGHM